MAENDATQPRYRCPRAICMVASAEGTGEYGACVLPRQSRRQAASVLTVPSALSPCLEFLLHCGGTSAVAAPGLHAPRNCAKSGSEPAAEPNRSRRARSPERNVASASAVPQTGNALSLAAVTSAFTNPRAHWPGPATGPDPACAPLALPPPAIPWPAPTPSPSPASRRCRSRCRCRSPVAPPPSWWSACPTRPSARRANACAPPSAPWACRCRRAAS